MGTSQTNLRKQHSLAFGTPEIRKAPSKVHHDRLGKLIDRHNVQHEKTITVLLLGEEGSGKSTIFKQMKHIFSHQEYTEEQREEFVPIIHKNILDGMAKTIYDASNKDNFQDHDSAATVRQWERTRRLRATETEVLSQLWRDEGIQEAWNFRGHVTIESLEYFMRKIDEIGSDDYSPTDDDILHCHMVTNGFVAKAFYAHAATNNSRIRVRDVDRDFLFDEGEDDVLPHHRDKKLEVIDTGGQRGDQRRYIHLFRNVSVVLFVAAINEFDTYYEEDMRSRQEVSLELFRETLLQRVFMDSAVVVFLNKDDLFREKLTKSSFKSYGVELYNQDNEYTSYELGYGDEEEPYAPVRVEQRNLDYKGRVANLLKHPPYRLDGSDEEFEGVYQDTCDYLKQKYLECGDDLPFERVKGIYIHFTTSTDTQNLNRIMNSAKDVLLTASLMNVGALV